MNLFKISQYGVLTSAFTAITSFVFLFIVNASLPPLDAANFRFLFNWGLTLSLAACLGWDTAIVRSSIKTIAALKLVAQQVLPAITICFCILAYIFESKYLQIVGFTTTLVSVLLHYNSLRADKDFINYIIGLNIKDKITRVVVFLVVSIFFDNNIFILFVCFYQLSILAQVKTIDLGKWIRSFSLFLHGVTRPTNIGYLLAGSYMIFISRGVYLSSPSENSGLLQKLDFIILFSSFLFVPIQTIMKYQEIPQGNKLNIYFGNQSNSTQIKLFFVELLIVIGVILAILYLDTLVIHSKISITLTISILLIFILLSCFPNPIQILTANKKKYAVVLVLTTSIICLIIVFSRSNIQDKLSTLYICIIICHSILVMANYDAFDKRFIVNRIIRTALLLSVLLVLGLLDENSFSSYMEF